MASRDHGDPGDAPTIAPPLTAVTNPARPSAAEEARTVAASTNIATLATLSADGDPWASLVTYGLLGGEPVLCVSQMAEHGRNLVRDARASVSIVAPNSPEDPLANTRITLAGKVRRPSAAELPAAQEAHIAAVPAARYYIEYSDFSVWLLTVDRVRWVGGYGRMDSASGAEYDSAAPDPVSTRAARAISHLNDDHGQALLAMAQQLGGYPDATAARCEGADRYGLDIRVSTPRGWSVTRVGYVDPIDSIDELRGATVRLAELTGHTATT
ncbi:MAG: HugZ family protein [Mycobacterium sp.]